MSEDEPTKEQVDFLHLVAKAFPYSETTVNALERAARWADALHDLDRGFAIRKDLVMAATYLGMEERALVAFAWCIAQSDRDPARFPQDTLLPMYKWIAATLPDFPTVSLAKIQAMEDDYEARLKQAGHGLRSLYKLRMKNANWTGFLRRGSEYERMWRSARKDDLSDCVACEFDSEVSALNRAGRYQEALQKARSLLSQGLQCETVPARTYREIIDAGLSLGELETAAEAFEVGYPLVKGKEKFLFTIGWHLVYLARVVDARRGLDLIETHLPLAIQADPVERMLFLAQTAVFLERLAATNPRPRKIRIPETLPFHNADNRYAPGDLAALFHGEARQLASRFDDRNGNTYISWHLADTRALAFGAERPQYHEP